MRVRQIYSSELRTSNITLMLTSLCTKPASTTNDPFHHLPKLERQSRHADVIPPPDTVIVVIPHPFVRTDSHSNLHAYRLHSGIVSIMREVQERVTRSYLDSGEAGWNIPYSRYSTTYVKTYLIWPTIEKKLTIFQNAPYTFACIGIN